MARRALTPAELRDLPAVLDPATAARVLGIGRTQTYRLLQTGRFPAPALRVGRRWRIPTAGLLRLLHLHPDQTAHDNGKDDDER